LLFLSAVIFIASYKNTFYMNAQTVNCVTFYLFWATAYRQMQTGVIPTQKKEIEGEENFPIQVHSEECYFYCGSCYFYFLYRNYKCIARAKFVKYYKKQIVRCIPQGRSLSKW